MPVALVGTAIDAENLVTALRARGLSQSELARRAGLSESTIIKVVHGRGNVSGRSFARIAAALAAVPELPRQLLEDLAAR